MRLALEEAEKARALDEVPIGAVIVRQGVVIGAGYNQRETKQNALSHAEVEAIFAACRRTGAWRLNDTTLYVTLEPCLMCAGAIYQARITRVVFGAYDAKAGCMGSLYRIHEDTRLNHRLPVVGGILEAECGGLLTEFFRQRRSAKKNLPTT